MENCIYIESNISLTYNKQEHVLPAGLGCVDKLEQGLVSDQANIIFSKYELDFLENTPLGFVRQRNIGKRGNLNKPVPTIVCNFGSNESDPELYVSIFDKTYGIAQLLIRDNDCAKMHAPSESEGYIFFELLKKITKETKFKFSILPNCKTKTIIIAYCNKKWYCYHSFIIKTREYYEQIVDCIINTISQLPNQLHEIQPVIKKEPKNKDIYVGKIMNTSSFINEYRVIIKTIINSLCYLFGRKIATDESLKEMKKFALGELEQLNIKHKKWIQLSDETIEIHPHIIKFYYDERWHCKISLFDEWFYDFELPIDLSSHLKNNQPKEYIVNWQNRTSEIK